MSSIMCRLPKLVTVRELTFIIVQQTIVIDWQSSYGEMQIQSIEGHLNATALLRSAAISASAPDLAKCAGRDIILNSLNH